MLLYCRWQRIRSGLQSGARKGLEFCPQVRDIRSHLWAAPGIASHTQLRPCIQDLATF